MIVKQFSDPLRKPGRHFVAHLKSGKVSIFSMPVGEKYGQPSEARALFQLCSTGLDKHRRACLV
jgi:hypothetical protein